jgi:hypothetical protein
MANVITALKAEIARIARREIRQVVVPLHKPVVATRHAVADLKRREVLRNAVPAPARLVLHFCTGDAGE